MSSFWMPKKQPLYAPMIASFGGGSARGYGRGKGRKRPDFLDVTFRQAPETSTTPHNASTNVADNYAIFTFHPDDKGHFSSASQFSYSVGSRILSFELPAGFYNYEIKGGQASKGSEPHTYYGTLSMPTSANVMLLCGLNGVGDYGAGGGTFLVLGSSYSTVVESDALLVAGGTGNTYGTFRPHQNTTSYMESTTSQARVRLSATSSSRNYDSGAGFLNDNAVTAYASSRRARNFNEGGTGAYAGPNACGLNQYGGFGGAGGQCPGGGGGYAGGHAGGDGPTTSGGAGTSYYNPNYATFISSNTPAQSEQARLSAWDSGLSGFLRLTGSIF